MNKDYTGENIDILEGLEAVRIRPGMYIGDVEEDGMHQLLWEVIDNSIDEHSMGFCHNLKVDIKDDNITIIDDGRGIPVDFNEKYQKNTAEILLTFLHSGGKFSQKNYRFSSGLHGVGISVVNALSSYLKVVIKRDGKIYQQEFSEGKPISSLIDISSDNSFPFSSGTMILFSPDRKIMHGQLIKERILNRLSQLNALNPNLVISLEYNDEKFVFSGKKLSSFLSFPCLIPENIDISFETENINLNFLFNYATVPETNFFFVNNIHTTLGGTHVNLVKNLLVRFFQETIKKNFPKEDVESQDIKTHLHLVIKLQLANPIFAGQTKDRLTSSLSEYQLSEILQKKLLDYFLEHPNLIKVFLEIFKQNKKERSAISLLKTKTRGEIVDAASLGGKFRDCSTTVFDEREIFIVEGESAGSTVKQARNRHTQAVLSMKGKFLNAGKNDLVKIKKNEEINIMCDVLGISLLKQDMTTLKYNKIIIMTDADHDGMHIVNLHLVLFFTYMREIIEKGHLFLAVPPLYCLRTKSKILGYCYNDQELKELENKFSGQKLFIQRFKGLGEMNPEQLKMTTMEPNSRKLLKIKIGDLSIAENQIQLIMGSDATFRRELVLYNDNMVSSDIDTFGA